jgi:bile acid:Na+ symporter, BASS family
MTIDQVISLLASVKLFEMMVAIGLGVTFADLARVARDWRLLTRAALASYVCVPAAAVGLLFLFQPHTEVPADFPLIAAGFLIAAVCPGSPYGPPFTRMANGNVVVAVGLMAVLAGSSALLAPILLQFLLPLTSGDARVQIDVLQLVATLLIAQLLPLCIGLAVRQWFPAVAARVKGPAGLLSVVLNLLTLGVLLSVQFDMLMGVPLRAYLGMFALLMASVTAGWLLGPSGRGNRMAMAMATGVRNVGVSLVIAASSFAGTPAVTAATVFALFQTVLMALVALGWGRLASASGAETKAEEPPNEPVARGAAS